MKKLALFCLLLSGSSLDAAIRLKELVAIEGVRDNQLVGYGLVVGLRGTGDRQQSIFSAQSLTNLLQRMGVSVSPTLIQVKNTAAVMLTATLPPYASPGTHLDVTVAAIADCTSLQGGILVMTGLKAPDGQVYAVAQGPTVVSGFIAGTGGNGSQVNHPTVGRIPDGAIVERAGPAVKLGGGPLRLQLREADFTTAARVASAVNAKFGPIANAENAGVVSVGLPAQFQKTPIEFVSELERLTIDPDHKARIVVNERTGTIIMGKDVHIAPVAIMQGNLTVAVQTTLNVTQPNALSPGGTTQVTPQVDVGVKEEKARDVILRDGATVEELVRALSVIGSTPRDIISILQTLKSAGALEAELEVI